MNIERSQSQLVCMRCGTSKPLFETVQFRCQENGCGGLYEVRHDYGFFSDRPVGSWKQKFDEISVPGVHPRKMSGVWRFAPFIMPSLDEGEMMTLGEGLSPILPAGPNLTKWLGSKGINIYIILEGTGPTGAFKDFGMTVAISVAKAMGINTVACASTGDTSAAAAAYAARAGMKCVVILPKGKVTSVQLSQPLLHGARIIEIPGEFDDAMKIVAQLALEGRVFPVNSLNPTRIEGHMASVFLATQFFGWNVPDVFVVPLGNGSNTTSIGKGVAVLQQLGFTSKEPKIIGGQSQAASPLAASWCKSHHINPVDGHIRSTGSWLEVHEHWLAERLGQTTASASKIGAPVSFEKVIAAIEKSQGAVFTAPEGGLNMAMLTAGADGIPVCPQTGTALYALKEAINCKIVRPGQTVVVVATASSIKFPEVAVTYGGNLITYVPSCKTDDVAKFIGV